VEEPPVNVVEAVTATPDERIIDEYSLDPAVIHRHAQQSGKVFADGPAGQL